MCYICRVRFLCRVYRLVHHCSARHPCAPGPWRDVVLAPLSIIPHLPEPRARCEGGGMCCSCGTSSLLPTMRSLPPPLTIVPRLNCVFRAFFFLCIALLSLRYLRGASFLAAKPMILMTGDDWMLIVPAMGKARSACIHLAPLNDT